MKYSASEDVDEPLDVPVPAYPLAGYLTVVIVLLVIVSVTAVSGILYFTLNKSLNSEFEEGIQAKGGEAGQVFQNRINRLSNRLNALAHDNTVRVTLMLGAHRQLSQHLHTVYNNIPDLHFIIKDAASGSFFTPSEVWIDGRQIEKVFPVQTSEPVLVNTIENGGFQLIQSVPIRRQQEQVGVAAATYQISKDEHLQSLFGKEGKYADKLVYFDKGEVWDLLSGRKLSSSLTFPASFYHDNSLDYITLNGEDFAVSKRAEFDGVYFFGNLRNLRAAKNRVLNAVLFPAIIVILLTLLTSIFLSRKLVEPLRQLTRFAHKITSGENDISNTLATSRIYEFNRLRVSLFSMLDHIRQAREMERYQDLFEGVADMVFINDLHGSMIDVNKVALDKLGYPFAELTRKNLYDLVLPVQKNMLQRKLETLQTEKEQLVFETEIMDSAGKHLSVECHARKIVLRNQVVILNVVRDISARAQAEKALQESHSTLLTVLNSIQATIYVSDIETREILFMNACMSESFGGNRIGGKCHKVVYDNTEPCRRCQSMQPPSPCEIPTKVLTWEGRNPVNGNWYVHHDRIIRWVNGRSVKFQIAFDITEKKELELKSDETRSQLRKAQKMESIATLAGGIAHDLNNILSGIVSYPDLLLVQYPDDSSLKVPLQIIKDTGLKASAIVQDLLTLARRGVVVNEVINLNNVVNRYLESPEHRQLIRDNPHVEIKVDLQPGLVNILGSSLHLSKTIMNLVINAVEAIQESGYVSIATAVTIIDDEDPRTEKIGVGEYVVLVIGDTGAGISPEDQDRIYEPFFTTKVMGRSGTGLGMAVVWGAVEDHEGYIDLQTVPGEGTTFSLYFPVTRRVLLQEQLELTKNDYHGRGESILVIDDMTEQRDLASMMFGRMGYNVITVPSGEKAIDFLNQHSVDLLLLDMLMDGGMNGLETYRRILQIHPGQRAVITTGYSETEQVKEALRLGAGSYIRKPYLFEDIALAVKNELAKEKVVAGTAKA
ncbi:response regulator [Desulfopila inferna]|uniref:response regulator n=1 Tax=Desulfopila inferna TaxID=468528 RepID=UPI001964B6A2|nr:response regulator [Desulfopila inferna]MBM9605576.1 response regulator [Desulfopila inferna]